MLWARSIFIFVSFLFIFPLRGKQGMKRWLFLLAAHDENVLLQDAANVLYIYNEKQLLYLSF